MNLDLNLRNLRERIIKAAESSGRDPEAIEILPVTKFKSPDLIRKLQTLGFSRCGENYIQEIEQKSSVLPNIEWVAIGHLQTNKASLAARLCSTILSLDSMRLAKDLDRQSQRIQKDLTVWIQVDLWEQTPLKGCLGSEVSVLFEYLESAPYLHFGGLMVLPPLGEERAFQMSNLYRLDMEQKIHRNILLSMGMSDDLELAIQHGSNQLRIGSALLGPR
jgi:pyridoxal phosphate enzyme (YggS family)